MEKFTERAQLRDFARERGVRPDWHEPDEQGLTATVEGSHLDNCGFWPLGALSPDAPRELLELHVILREYDTINGREVRGAPIAAVNLATLLAWASEPPAPRTARVVEATEAAWRKVIADEVRRYAQALGDEIKPAPLGSTFRLIISEIADKIEERKLT